MIGNSKNSTRMVAHYKMDRVIGEGAHGSVEVARDTKFNDHVAIKFINKVADPGFLQQTLVCNEINALLRIKSEHVIKLFDYNMDVTYTKPDGSQVESIMLVTEYCNEGDLFENIFHAQRMSPRLARTYFKQLIKGIEACHKIGVVHRDIKAQNVILDAGFKLKIIDFGFAYHKKYESELVPAKRSFGTKGYKAPEILARRPTKGFSADIFSSGVLLFIMLAGYPPFERALETDRWYISVLNNDYQGFWQKHQSCNVPDEAKPLIWWMLAPRDEIRIKIAGIKESAWFNGPVMDDKELRATMAVRRQRIREARQAAARRSRAAPAQA